MLLGNRLTEDTLISSAEFATLLSCASMLAGSIGIASICLCLCIMRHCKPKHHTLTAVADTDSFSGSLHKGPESTTDGAEFSAGESGAAALTSADEGPGSPAPKTRL